MALDYITNISLNQILNDKTTGQNLAGGTLWFYEDDNRTTPKPVFEKINIGGTTPSNPPEYTFVPLANPLVLSGTGTIMDANGNQVSLYYYPWDSNGDLQLYYVACFNYLGEPQFTREGWPDTFETENPDINTDAGLVNQISNPQFVKVLFDPTIGMTINVSGTGTSTVNIAPGWQLVIGYIGSGKVVVSRTSIAGSANIPTNPSYTLTITPSGSLSSIQLVQTLANTPGIWSPQMTDTGGYVSSSITLAANTAVTMTYAPSIGASTILLTANNLTTGYVSYNNTVELPASANTATSDTGFVNISIGLSTTVPSTLTSVQVVGNTENAAVVLYEQQTPARQVDQLFHYFDPLLEAKPIDSYLAGWDFPQNPAQFFNAGLYPIAGADSSFYVWDNLIIYQSVASSFTPSRAADGSLVITTNAITQLAFVTYVPQYLANELLGGRLAMNVAASTNVTGGLLCNATVWYTKTTLPSTIASAESIVHTLDANGYPLTQYGTWLPVPRSNLSNSTVVNNTYTNVAQFTIHPTGNDTYNNYGFNGWDMQGAADVSLATWVAVVIGTASIPSGKTITLNSGSLVPGDIWTRPAPQTADQVLAQCQSQFESSFDIGTYPQQNLGTNTGEFIGAATTSSGAANSLLGTVFYKVTKWTIPTTLTLYNPAAANAQIRDETATADWSASRGINNHEFGFYIAGTVNGGTNVGNICGVHWASDARYAQ